MARWRGRPVSLRLTRSCTGREVDFLIDLGVRRVAIEAKSGQTLYRDAYRGLVHYRAMSPDTAGVLIYGGHECYRRSGTTVLGWDSVT